MINNKQGKGGGVSPISLVLAIGLLIIIFVALGSGGISALTNIFKFLAKVPGWVWVIVGVFFLFSWIGGGKKRR